MPRKLYKITTTLEEHPDFTARLKKRTNEIYSFFSFNQGDVEKMKKTKIDFEAGAGYTVKNIEKTDYINCSPPLLFSERFVEKIGNQLSDEMEFFPCNLICQGISLNWYAARIIRKMSIIDKVTSTYSILSEGEKVIRIANYRKDIEEHFYIARDEENIPYWVVSEYFMDLCKENGLLIRFKEV